MRFGVVTRVADPRHGGNMAEAITSVMIEVRRPMAPDWRPVLQPVTEVIGPSALALRVPVFRLGEILVMPDGGLSERELVPPYRKPSKWDVDVELFDDLTEAILVSCRVVEEAQP